MTTNRQFILNCIQGMSDESLLTIWDTIFEFGGQKPPILSACETCEADHDGQCPGELHNCFVDATAWMKREAVLRK